VGVRDVDAVGPPQRQVGAFVERCSAGPCRGSSCAKHTASLRLCQRYARNAPLCAARSRSDVIDVRRIEACSGRARDRGRRRRIRRVIPAARALRT